MGLDLMILQLVKSQRPISGPDPDFIENETTLRYYSHRGTVTPISNPLRWPPTQSLAPVHEHRTNDLRSQPFIRGVESDEMRGGDEQSSKEK